MRVESVNGNTYASNSYSSEVSGGKDFSDMLMQVTTSQGLTLRGSGAADEGETIVQSWVDARTGINTAVYRSADFDEEDPVYHVKIWDADGNLTERMTAIKDIDTRTCDTADMYTMACHLEHTGEAPKAVWNFMISKDHYMDRHLDSYDAFSSMNWVEIVRYMMDMQYKLKNMSGYLSLKRFYDML